MRQIHHVLALLRMRLCFPLSCLGIGLVSTWSELSFIHSPLSFGSLAEPVFQTFNLSSVVPMALVALLLRLGKINRPLVSRPLCLATTLALLLMATAASFCAMLLFDGLPWLLILSAVIGGVGLGFLFVMWFEVVSHLKPADLLLAYALGCVLRVVLIWFGSGMQPDRQGIWLGLVALAAIVLLRLARNAVAKETPVLSPSFDSKQKDSSHEETRCAFPVRPLLFVVTGTLTLSFALGLGGSAAGTNGNPGVLGAALLAIVLVVLKGDNFQFKWLWQCSIALIATAIVVYALFGAGLPLISGFLVCASYELCLMLVYCILGDLVYRSFYNSTFLYSLEICIALSAGMAGDLLLNGISHAFPSSIGLALTLVCSLLALLYAVTAVRTFSDPDLQGRWSTLIRQPVGQDMAPLLERSRLGLRCHELAGEAGLSSREEEILLLMAQRKKPSAIAEQLVIAVSTVNTHKKHIYRKLDVHSAKELQARIGQVDED